MAESSPMPGSLDIAVTARTFPTSRFVADHLAPIIAGDMETYTNQISDDGIDSLLQEAMDNPETTSDDVPIFQIDH